MPIELFFIMGIFTLILGYVIGNFVPMMKDNPFAAKKDEAPSEKLPGSEESQAQPEMQVEASKMDTRGLLEIAHLWRHEDTKKLVAQIENQYINHGDELTGDQHALLSLLLLDLGEWVGLEGRMRAVEDLQAEEENAEEEERKPAFFNPINIMKDAMTADVYLPHSGLSLADQIDPILQSMLADSPLVDRGVSLMDIEGRGMVVNVGLDLYDSVGDVPDDDIRALIQKAVAVWEKRVTGNK